MKSKIQEEDFARFRFDISSSLPGRPLRKAQSKRLERAVLKELEEIQNEENLRYGQEQLVERMAVLARVVIALGLIVSATAACVIYMMVRT